MIPNRKKKQTNKEIKTPSACENNLACLNAINHNIMFKPICPPTHYPAVTNPFCLPVPQSQTFKTHHTFVGVDNVVDFLLFSLFVF